MTGRHQEVTELCIRATVCRAGGLRQGMELRLSVNHSPRPVYPCQKASPRLTSQPAQLSCATNGNRYFAGAVLQLVGYAGRFVGE
jgi:hypothetical protein